MEIELEKAEVERSTYVMEVREVLSVLQAAFPLSSVQLRQGMKAVPLRLFAAELPSSCKVCAIMEINLKL